MFADVFEIENATVFEEAAHDAAHANVLRQVRNAGSQHADAPDDEVDRDSALRSFIKAIDDLLISQPIQFRDDTSRTSRFRVRRFALEWTGACACGSVVVALVANGLTWGFSYWYHPYLERVTLPPWSYGALLGLALGAVQGAVLHRRFHLGIVWLVASAVGSALGLEAAIAIAKIAGPVAYGIVLGCVVGGAQWAVLRTRVRQAAWWVLTSAVALSVVMLSCAVNMHTTLAGVNALSHNPLAVQPDAYGAAVTFLSRGLYGPTTSADLALEFAVMATCGLVIGALTAKPLMSSYAHQERS